MGDKGVTIDDVEARFRALAGEAGGALGTARPTLVTGGIVGGIGLLALSFLLGRRRGRRRATVLEIHRG